MLSESDLARMRASQASILSESCTIIRDTAVSDGMGGQDTTEGETASTCRVGTTAWRAEELELAGQIVAGIPYYVTLPYGTEVCEADRIEVGGRTFEVMMVMRPTNETARQCICKEIR